jgi:hypothetical protein
LSLICAVVALSPVPVAHADVDSAMTTVGGSSASVRVIISITTALGTSSDDDVKVVAVLGAAQSGFSPNVPPFTQSQLYGMTFNLANTTFNFQLFCLPLVSCQNLNVSVSDLQFDLVAPACSPLNAAGNGSFANATFHVTGNYLASGLTSASGAIDATNPAAFGARFTNPIPGAVRMDQLTIANQTFTVPPDQLPTGVTAMSLTIESNLTNTAFAGPFVVSPFSFDADNDGVFDACDTCTDTDGDGFGNSGFANNTCAADNCPDAPNPSQADRDSDGVGNACDCLADIAPSATGGDGAVNVTDLLLVIGSWGTCANPSNCPADAAPITPTSVGDGAVNVTDLLLIIGAWGTCP